MRLVASACLAGLALASSANGAALLAWDFGTSNGNVATSAATGVDATMQASTLSRGAGMPAFASGFEPTRGSFTTTDSGAAPGTLSAAVTRNSYFQFSAAPQSGIKMSLSSIDFVAWQQNAHASATIGLQYSLDGFASAGVDAGSVTSINDGWSGTQKSIDVSAVSALQDVTQSVSFRLYYYGFGGWEQQGLGQISGANTDLTVIGTSAAVPEPVGPTVLGLSAMAMLLRRRNTPPQ